MLHGWGANYQDLAPLASMLDCRDYQFLFPNAPFPHPQVPGGRAWYALDSNQYDGITESRQQLLGWLLALQSNLGVPLEKTILAGFSQGGAMSLDVGLELPLAGLCCLSGYLQFEPQPLAGKTPPVLMIHGKQDMVVPITAAQQARDELSAIGINIEYHELNMGHEIPLPALAIVQNFLKKL